MSLVLKFAVVMVNLALIFYTSFFITAIKEKKISKRLLLFLSFGLTFDVIATALMVAGSSNGPFTLHGIIGYSSLTCMAIDTFLIWNNKIKNGINYEFSSFIAKYSKFAYIWWIISYLTGAVLVAVK